jgi:hypothetical protein
MTGSPTSLRILRAKVLAWIEGRMAMRDEIEAYEANLSPGARHRLRMTRERESDEEPAPTEAG